VDCCPFYGEDLSSFGPFVFAKVAKKLIIVLLNPFPDTLFFVYWFFFIIFLLLLLLLNTFRVGRLSCFFIERIFLPDGLGDFEISFDGTFSSFLAR